MKHLFLFCLMSLALSCKKDSGESDYDASFTAWSKFKESSGNSYEYIVTTSSWVGVSDSTTITIAEGEGNRKAVQTIYNSIPLRSKSPCKFLGRNYSKS